MTNVLNSPFSVRRQLRELFKVLLLNNTTAGKNVSTSRAELLWRSELPALVIYLQSAPATERNRAPREWWIDQEVAVEVFTTEDPLNDMPADDLLDQLVAEVETLGAQALGTIAALVGGDLARCNFLGTEVDFDALGERLVGNARVRFVFGWTYEPQQIDPADLEALELVHVEMDIADPPTGPELTDDIDIETT